MPAAAQRLVNRLVAQGEPGVDGNLRSDAGGRPALSEEEVPLSFRPARLHRARGCAEVLPFLSEFTAEIVLLEERRVLELERKGLRDDQDLDRWIRPPHRNHKRPRTRKRTRVTEGYPTRMSRSRGDQTATQASRTRDWI
jgi:hypothetical protein